MYHHNVSVGSLSLINSARHAALNVSYANFLVTLCAQTFQASRLKPSWNGKGCVCSSFVLTVPVVLA